MKLHSLTDAHFEFTYNYSGRSIMAEICTHPITNFLNYLLICPSTAEIIGMNCAFFAFAGLLESVSLSLPSAAE